MSALLDEVSLEQLIRLRPADVDRALIEVGPLGKRLGLEEMAPLFRASPTQDPAGYAQGAILYLTTLGLLGKFSAILAAEDMSAVLEAQRANMSISNSAGKWIFGRGRTARCAIFRGGGFVGSGCIVGPSLVLTSAHVIGPANENGEFDALTVRLYNHEQIEIESRPVVLSPPAAADSILPMSTQDAAFAGYNDIALLRTRLPVGSDPCLVELPANDWEPTDRAALMLYHFPQGQDEGIGNCTLDSYSNPSLRWAYTSPAEPGSSGGACLNGAGKLIGVHQGRRNSSAPASRLVPLSAPQIINGVSQSLRHVIAGEVSNDVWPSYIWSLDGRMDGVVVIGRGDLFRAFAHMGRADAAYRALRVRREDPGAGTDGLGYSVQLVRAFIDRQPRHNRILLLSWPQACDGSFDPVERLAQEARALGLAGAAAGNEAAGIATGETGSATVVKGRVEGLLGEIHQTAEQRGETVWLVVEHLDGEPAEEHVIAIEAIAGLAPRWSRLRVVLVGNEAVSPFTDEVRLNAVTGNPGPSQALVEYLGPIRKQDVMDFIANVRRQRDHIEMDEDILGAEANGLLNDLAQDGGRYALSHMPLIVARLRSLLQ